MRANTDDGSTHAFAVNRDRGRLTMPPLPHHRAYGPVPRRFGGLSLYKQCHSWQAQTTEAGVGQTTVQGSSETYPPRPLRAENSRKGRSLGNSETTEFVKAPPDLLQKELVERT
jgi:hypothetical protein